jgi:hypothetical protein
VTVAAALLLIVAEGNTQALVPVFAVGRAYDRIGAELQIGKMPPPVLPPAVPAGDAHRGAGRRARGAGRRRHDTGRRRRPARSGRALTCDARSPLGGEPHGTPAGGKISVMGNQTGRGR